MYAFSKLTVLAVSALGFASSALAVPVEGTPSSDLAARAPYDVHNGWVSEASGSDTIIHRMSDYIHLFRLPTVSCRHRASYWFMSAY
jgi:hypothetical protein